MTRTGKSPRLSDHTPEPCAALSPQDAQARKITEGQLVKVISRYGEIVVRATISPHQRPGDVFVPMHWSNQFASNAIVDKIVNAELDPVSGQPEFKHTPAEVVSYSPVWYGFLLSRRKLPITQAAYWVKTQSNGFYRYEIAGEQSVEDWPEWARALLCASDREVNWIEYLDAASRRYRGARLTGDHLESCIFIGPDHELPPRSWLAGLFNKPVSRQERIALLSAKPPAGAVDAGKTVCACFNVGEATISNAIKEQNLSSVEQIGIALKAGTNCGSCVPELRSLLQRSKRSVA
jgi:assimilatory nitrate reductase catalytic subunit